MQRPHAATRRTGSPTFQLRDRAEAERRSLNQEAIRLLEAALQDPRLSFRDAHAAFVEAHGPPPFGDDFFDGLRSPDPGQPSPFGGDVPAGDSSGADAERSDG